LSEPIASPIKSLFAGQVPDELLVQFPEPSADERETVSTFLGSLRDFAREKIDPGRIDREKRIPPEVVRGLEARIDEPLTKAANPIISLIPKHVPLRPLWSCFDRMQNGPVEPVGGVAISRQQRHQRADVVGG